MNHTTTKAAITTATILSAMAMEKII